MYWSGWVGKATPWTNGSGYRNPEIDKLIEATAVSSDPVQRVKLFHTFQQTAQRDLPLIPLIELRFFSIHSSNLRDLTVYGDQVYASLKNAWFAEPSK